MQIQKPVRLTQQSCDFPVRLGPNELLDRCPLGACQLLFQNSSFMPEVAIPFNQTHRHYAATRLLSATSRPCFFTCAAEPSALNYHPSIRQRLDCRTIKIEPGPNPTLSRRQML